MTTSEPESKFVLDANFFIEGNGSIQAPATVYTTSSALREVRDRRSHDRLSHFQLTHELITREPSTDSVSRVTSCSRDSGDLSLLSGTDISLLALALDFLPPEPPSAAPVPSFGEWITPETYLRVDDYPSTICTADAAMQCVALLLGLRVMSPTGQRIAEVKRWLLRCSACGAETRDASREFCPECGQHELVRYALVSRAGEERELPLPKRFEPTARGKRYPIPTATGGKGRPPDLILSEDMMWEAKRKWAWTGGKRAMKAAMGDGTQFFEPRKKPRPEPTYGYGKMNPNAPRKTLGKRKKA
jgi:RNA-binding protein NOB1